MPLRNVSADYNSAERAEYGGNLSGSMIFTDATVKNLLLFSYIFIRRDTNGIEDRGGSAAIWVASRSCNDVKLGKSKNSGRTEIAPAKMELQTIVKDDHGLMYVNPRY